MNKEQKDEVKRLGLIKIIACKEEKKRDEKGRVIWQKFYDGTTSEWKYDEKGRLIWHKDTAGTTEEWRYNKKGRLIWEKYPNGIYYIYSKGYRKVISLDKEVIKCHPSK